MKFGAIDDQPKYYRQATTPTDITIGTRWDEVSSGNIIESWIYNGSQWESFIKTFNWFSSGGASTSTGFPVRNDYLFKILNWDYTLISNTAWNTSNFVAVTLWRSSSATNTVISTVTYNTGTVGQVRQIRLALNQTFDFQTTVADRLALGVTVTGTVSFNYSVIVSYQFFRR